MGIRAETEKLIEIAYKELEQHNPMTVRQCYYRLVSLQVIENKKSAYQKVSQALVYARVNGLIPWDWIEDRTRRPRDVSMWTDLPDFSETAKRAYRKNIWLSQPNRVEVWLEKDALSGIFEEILNYYGVTLNVGRGYDGWSSIKGAADRFDIYREDGCPIYVLYFGDFDPSGEDMVRSLIERVGSFGTTPEVEKIALTKEDIRRHRLPSDFTKHTDARRGAFVAKHGDISVELDALPIEVLQRRIHESVQEYMDMAALKECKRIEEIERTRLTTLLQNA